MNRVLRRPHFTRRMSIKYSDGMVIQARGSTCTLAREWPHLQSSCASRSLRPRKHVRKVIRYSHSTSVAIFCLFNTKSLNKYVKCISWRDQGNAPLPSNGKFFGGILGQVVSFPYLRKPSNSTDVAWGRVEPT